MRPVPWLPMIRETGGRRLRDRRPAQKSNCALRRNSLAAMTLVGVGHVALNVGLYAEVVVRVQRVDDVDVEVVLVRPNRRSFPNAEIELIDPVAELRVRLDQVYASRSPPVPVDAQRRERRVRRSARWCRPEFAERLTPGRLENVPATCTSIFGIR